MLLAGSFLILLLGLFSHCSVDGVYVVRTAPEHGENVCIVEKKKEHVTLKRKVASSIKDIPKDCGVTTETNLDCDERKIKTVISYVPHKTTKTIHTADCCPGWKDYKHYTHRTGCFSYGPCISLSQNTPERCIKERARKLVRNQAIYTLSKPPKTPTDDPSNPTNLQNVFVFPLLNMTFKQAAQLSASDPHELPWLLRYQYLLTTFRNFLEVRLKPPYEKYTNISDFIGLYETVRDLLTKDGQYKEYFRYPSLMENFKDIIHNDHWKDDQVFVEERLAALNPMSLKRLTNKRGHRHRMEGVRFSDIKRKLNANFPWDAAISVAVGKTTKLYKMVREDSVFVIHYPYLEQISNTMDIMDLNPKDDRKIKTSNSPIALFVSVKSPETSSYVLKPVAIQFDAGNDAPVYQPSDGNKWLLAKQIFQVADFAHVEMIEHLLRTHLVLQPICTIAKRSLSEFHPLSQVLRWHCRGLLVTNTNGFPKLVNPNGYMHMLFSIGNVGAIELLNRGYADLTWEDTDFAKNIKKRGVADKTKLPYFPYRDDGLVIWQQVQSFVKDYVKLYYRKNKDLSEDIELQNFANDVSSAGSGTTGGMGMLKGFPRRILRTKRLVETLTRILWLPIQHNAVNYPIAYYGAFVPNMPTRLYDDPRGKPDEFSFHTLPDSHIATVQSVVAMSLGSLRMDNFLDYSSGMKDKDAAALVNKHYNILTTKIKKTLEERNQERFKEGHLTYPYLVPGWFPNSIYT